MCNIRRLYLLRKLYEADFQNPGDMEADEYELTSDVFRRAVSK